MSMYRDEQRGCGSRGFVSSRLYPRFCIISAERSTRRRAVSLKILLHRCIQCVALRHALRRWNQWTIGYADEPRDRVSCKVYRILFRYRVTFFPCTFCTLKVIVFSTVICLLHVYKKDKLEVPSAMEFVKPNYSHITHDDCVISLSWT